jgi:hypothetical protein
MRKAAGFFLGIIFSLSVLAGVSFAAEKLAYVDLSRSFSE